MDEKQKLMNNNIFFVDYSHNNQIDEYDLIFCFVGDNQFFEEYKQIIFKLDETILPNNFKIAVITQNQQDNSKIIENIQQQNKPFVIMSNNNKFKEKIIGIETEKTIIITPKLNNTSSSSHTIMQYVKKIQSTQNRQLFLLGYQSYYTENKFIEELKKQGVECIRLAEVQKDLLEIEPILRETNFMYLDLSSIKNNELQAISTPLPAGFSSIEICKMFHYFGLSQTNQIVFLEGYDPQKDIQEIGATQIAQYFWHFISSMNFRKEYIKQKIDFEIKIVEKKDPSLKLKFRKCPLTERWWFETTQDNWHSCSYLDYYNVQKAILSNRLSKYFVR